jgi:hypothetical protein
MQFWRMLNRHYVSFRRKAIFWVRMWRNETFTNLNPDSSEQLIQWRDCLSDVFDRNKFDMLDAMQLIIGSVRECILISVHVRFLKSKVCMVDYVRVPVMYLYGSCVASFVMKLVITSGKAKCTYWVIGPVGRGIICSGSINFFIDTGVLLCTCMLYFRISDDAYLYLPAWEKYHLSVIAQHA